MSQISETDNIFIPKNIKFLYSLPMQIMSDVVEEMVCYMENHTDFARRQVAKLGALGDEKNTIRWAELSKILNALGQVKSPEQWQAVSRCNVPHGQAYHYWYNNPHLSSFGEKFV